MGRVMTDIVRPHHEEEFKAARDAISKEGLDSIAIAPSHLAMAVGLNYAAGQHVDKNDCTVASTVILTEDDTDRMGGNFIFSSIGVKLRVSNGMVIWWNPHLLHGMEASHKTDAGNRWGCSFYLNKLTLRHCHR